MNRRMAPQLQMEQAAPCLGEVCLKGQAKLNPAIYLASKMMAYGAPTNAEQQQQQVLPDLRDSAKRTACPHKDCSIVFKMQEFTNNRKLS